MKMEIVIPNQRKKFKLEGEVKTLTKILNLIMTMNQDEQNRTLTYLVNRYRNQGTIGEVKISNTIKDI